jgi:DNA-binding NarL/FixJ family response regulator
MKALVIADDDFVLDRIRSLLESQHVDVIVYRWLLKALDNVEEIEPQLVIISTRDYPRHWKTFVQYANGIENTKAPKVILYADKEFSLEEKKKAQALGINGIFPDECTDEEFRTIIQQVIDTVYSKKEQDNNVASTNNTIFAFTNPITNAFVSGKVKSFIDNVITFIPDFMESVLQIQIGTQIKLATLKTNTSIIGVKAIVSSLPSQNTSNEMILRIEG